MSSTPSTSSLVFMRSVTSLYDDYALTPPLGSRVLSSPALGSRVGKSFLRESTIAREEADKRDASLTHLPYAFAEWRVFLNCVDTFNTKHIAEFLSTQEFGSLRPPEMVEEEAEEEYDPNLDFLYMRGEGEKKTYQIVGSLTEHNAEFQHDIIQRVDRENRKTFFQRLVSCGFIVYDISRNPSQIEEARWVLNTLLDELEKLERYYSDYADQVDVPTFILISTYMTWALTKPVDAEEPGMPFREMDYKSRKCHPNFKEHFDLENEVVEAGKAYPDRFRTLVLCSGLIYGGEEDTLDFLFRMAWNNEPPLPLFDGGRNYIPLVHVRDLAMMLFTVLELFPFKIRYLLAVEQNISSVRSITKAISSALTTGETEILSLEEFLLFDVPQDVYDCLTVNVRMEPHYFVESEQMIWSEIAFPLDITNIVREYRKARNLDPIRIIIAGPPACGKTLLAKKLCEYYQLHYISKKSIGEIIVQQLKDKIERLKAKQERLKEEESVSAMEKHMQEEMKAKMKAEAAEEEGEEEFEGEVEAIEEEEIEEEYLDVVEDEKSEPISKLVNLMDELVQVMEDNEGRLDDDRLFKYAKEILKSPESRNQGFVLDGFPETIEQLNTLFDHHDWKSVDEDDSRCVDYAIVIEASDDYIIDKVLSLTEAEIQEKQYAEEQLMKKLDDYRADNLEESQIMRLMSDHGVETFVIPVEEDESLMLHDTLENLKVSIGEPHNFGTTPEEKEEDEKQMDDAKKWVDAQELARKQELEKLAHTERIKNLEEWVTKMDELISEEEEALAAESVAIRHYLAHYIFPTLTRGLIEVARVRPDDPVDFLAEYIFKYNPDGKVLEPDDTHQYRKLFETIRRDVERLREARREAEEAERRMRMSEAGEEESLEEEEEKEFNILDLQVGERPAGTIY